MPLDVEAELEADRAMHGAAPMRVTRDPETIQSSGQPRVAPQRPRPSLAPETPAAPPVPPPVVPSAVLPADPKPAEPVAASRRALDESLLTVLREEAERETAVRRAETPRPLETQADLGLEETSAASAASKAVRDRLSKLRGQEPEVTEKPTARRDLLPDIEEINSTLRASTENRTGPATGAAGVSPPARSEASGSGFRSGFSLMLLLSVLALFTYVAAPRISEFIPGIKAPLASYVSRVDQVRNWMDTVMKNATNGLHALTGTNPG